MRLLLRAVIVWNFLRWAFRHRTERTNATFLHAATKQRNDKDQRPPRWYWLPGWQRLAWKIAIVFGPGIIAWWWFQLTRDAAAILVFLLALVIGNLIVAAITQKWRGRKHTAAVVEPLQTAVDHVLKSAA